MIERAQMLDVVRDEPAWIADCVEELWDNPEKFERGETFEEPDGVAPEDYNLFRYGVLFGIEYEREYPTDSDEWRGDADGEEFDESELLIGSGVAWVSLVLGWVLSTAFPQLTLLERTLFAIVPMLVATGIWVIIFD